jgi:hypothetical protein
MRKMSAKIGESNKKQLKVFDYETGITIFKKTKSKKLPNTRKSHRGSPEQPTSSVQ